jgi:hypothetical protein
MPVVVNLIANLTYALVFLLADGVHTLSSVSMETFMELSIIYANGIILSMIEPSGIDSLDTLHGPGPLYLSITLIMTMEVLSGILHTTIDLITLITDHPIIILTLLLMSTEFLTLLLLMSTELFLLEEYITNDDNSLLFYIHSTFILLFI